VSLERREEIATRLDSIAEELAELAMDALRQAIDDGATARPDAERRLSQARRAVEKAAGVLRAR
jgi:hypothetical protein